MISVVIPVYRREKQVLLLIKDLSTQKISEGLEVIVVDDGGFIERIKTDLLSWEGKGSIRNVEYVKITQLSGPAYARNKGAELARGALLWFLDSDVRLPSADVAAVLKEQLENSEFALAVGGEFQIIDGRKYWVIKRVAFNGDTISEYKENVSAMVYVDYLATCNMMLEKEVFWRLGGFETRFKFYGEDKFFGRKLQVFGGRSVFIKKGSVKHEPSPVGRIFDLKEKTRARLEYLRYFFPNRLYVIWLIDLWCYLVHFKQFWRTLRYKQERVNQPSRLRKIKNALDIAAEIMRGYYVFFKETF